jgi:hypothetical protein
MSFTGCSWRNRCCCSVQADKAPPYPLVRSILSGFRCQRIDRAKELAPSPDRPPPAVKFVFDPQLRQVLMVNSPKHGCCNQDGVKPLPAQNTCMSMLMDELLDLSTQWFTYWKRYTEQAEEPILCAFGGLDWVLYGTKEQSGGAPRHGMRGALDRQLVFVRGGLH